MNYIKLYIGDYLRDTGTLTLAQHGAYALMLLEHYASEQPLPDGRELHRLLRADSKAEREAIDYVLARFWTRTEAGYINNRASKEFARARDVANTNRDIALAREAKKRAAAEHETSTKRAPSVPRNEHENSTTPTPVPNIKPPSPSAKPPLCPDGVDGQVWDDWRALRKAKRAPVTATVVAGAVAEAAKAGMSLEAFLRVWCARGSQGLQADWLKPDERKAPNRDSAEPAWRTEQRNRMAQFAGRSAAKPAHLKPVIVEEIDAAKLVG